MVGDTPVSGQSSQELAEDRTNLAEDRTLMAVERTMASWMGTSMGAIGVGLGFRAIFGEIEPTWVPRLMSTFFMLLAIVIVQGARQRACKAIARMSSHMVDPPNTNGITLAAHGIAVGAAILTVGVWVFFE